LADKRKEASSDSLKKQLLPEGGRKAQWAHERDVLERVGCQRREKLATLAVQPSPLPEKRLSAKKQGLFEKKRPAIAATCARWG